MTRSLAASFLAVAAIGLFVGTSDAEARHCRRNRCCNTGYAQAGWTGQTSGCNTGCATNACGGATMNANPNFNNNQYQYQNGTAPTPAPAPTETPPAPRT